MTCPATFRPIEDRDIEFLQRVYATTRPDIDQAPLSDEQKQQIKQQQFQAQHLHYQSYFPSAKFDVILLDGRPVGRLYVERNDEEIRVLDIALLPEHRNNGIGSGILHGLLDEARQAGLPVRVWVEIFNPSLRLFARLGFKPLADPSIDWQKEANWHMEWLPTT